MKRVVVVLLSYLLVVVPAFPQSKSSPTADETMQSVFERVMHAVDVTNENCKSSECAIATAAVTDLVSAAEIKHKNHELIGAERDKFLGDIDKALTKTLDAVTHEKMKQDETAKLPKSDCDRTGLGYNQCQQCDIVYKAGLALCAAYAVTCPACVATCIIITTLAYTRCIRAYCV